MPDMNGKRTNEAKPGAGKLPRAGRRGALLSAAQAVVLALLGFGPPAAARAVTLSSAETGLSARLNEKSGEYRVAARDPAWSFSGSLGSAAHAVRTAKGRDRIGAYQQITFTWRSGQVPLRGTIQLYQNHPVVLFRYTYLKAASPPSVAFPSFTGIPGPLYHFSYRNAAFAPPQFELGQYGTPWLLFDGQANAMVLSPASHFIIAALHGDGDHLMASGLDQQLPSVPAGFSQETLMAIAPGIRRTWDLWGSALTALAGKKRPSNEGDLTLKYYGYWTDNGASYYYRYDPKLGYAGTLKAVIARYRKEKIPVHYLQLDSWWYDKSYPGISPNDLTGRWNSFGGIMRYHADASLFPQGLKAFQQSVGLPLVTHSRWISRSSPYRKSYRISGVAPIGMRWWNHIAAYLESSGVVTYEQDWQSLIDPRSPAFSNTIGTGAEFYDHMAAACLQHGLTMQYCMALPCDFLQGSRYGNLTSIRVSDDRFSPPRWRDFVYTSQLADAIGSWPWPDVYYSHETDNLLLDTLSAGPVGTGDALGAEDRKNILKAVRADGVIVKPDVPITPLDRMYVADARPRRSSSAVMAAHSLGGRTRGADSPFIGSTWTKDGSLRTAYVFAFSRSGKVHQMVRFSPEEAGARAPACVYDYFAHLVSRVGPGQRFAASIGPGETGYYIVAPVGPSGIALFGDKGKFVSMGKERIPSLQEDSRSLTAQVLFAAGENSVTLFGDAPSRPTVTVRGGSAGAVAFTKSTGYFSVRVAPEMTALPVKLNGDRVREIAVTFTR
jgi:hypothetical protein